MTIAEGTQSASFNLAVLDWSGVLVDEIDLMAELHSVVIRELSGSTITADEWKTRVSSDWTQLYVDEGVSSDQLGNAAKRFKELYRANVHRLQPTYGAVEFLALLKKRGIAVVILSNQFEDCLEYFLAAHNWNQYIDSVVAAKQLAAPKSGPEALWEILRRYDQSPAATFLVDDMDGGITLAKTAGVVAIGCRSPLGHHLQSADIIVDNLAELSRRLFKEEVPRSRMASTEYRAHYEARESSKSAGKIPRLSAIYHGENNALIRFVHKVAKVSNEAIIVDVGSGSSRHSARLCELFKFSRAIRVDIAASALRRGEQQQFQSSRMWNVQADAALLPIAACVADIILCLETLEHVVDPSAIFSELARVAKPGALLVIAVPNSMECTHPLLRGLQRRSHDAGHVREYTKAGLSDVLMTAGADPVWIGTRWFLAYWLAFSVERGRLCHIVSRIFVRLPMLEQLASKLVERLVYWELLLLGRRCNRGLGILAVVRLSA